MGPSMIVSYSSRSRRGLTTKLPSEFPQVRTPTERPLKRAESLTPWIGRDNDRNAAFVYRYAGSPGCGRSGPVVGNAQGRAADRVGIPACPLHGAFRRHRPKILRRADAD